MQHYKLIFYVPSEHCEAVKHAIFTVGGGQDKYYKHCAWQTAGTSQFTPLAQAVPFIGEPHKQSVVGEYRVEILCSESCIEQAITALKHSHPYEQPAFEVYSPATTGSLPDA